MWTYFQGGNYVMRINHNIAALNTYRQLNSAAAGQSKSMEKLSSGLRINRAGDDAAGLAISEKMRGQIRGLDMASKNAQDGISLIQTAEGALNETHSILQRMRELAVQSSNDTNTDADRGEIQKEIDQLTSEIDRIGNTTEFNTKKLINGGASVSGSVVDSADASFFKVVGGTGDTKVGTTIQIETSTLATAATTAGTTTPTNGTALTTASEVTINGTSFSFASGETNENVLKTINDAGLGVTASVNGSDQLVLTSNSVGSSSNIEISGVTGNFAGMATDSGTDASITLGSSAANFSQYSSQGNVITIEDGAAKGLQIEISGAATAATPVTDETTITVNSNGTLNFQIGANEGQEMNISINDMRASALGVNGLDVSSQTGASTAISTINEAIESVSSERSKLGAYQNRLDHTINNLGTSSENLTAAESRIRDVDYALAA
jgi:flagellin